MKKTHDLVYPSMANFMREAMGTCSQCGQTGGFSMEQENCPAYKAPKAKKSKKTTKKSKPLTVGQKFNKFFT